MNHRLTIKVASSIKEYSKAAYASIYLSPRYDKINSKVWKKCI